MMEFQMRASRRGVLLAGLAFAATVQMPLQSALAANASETAAAAQTVQRLNAVLTDMLTNGNTLGYDGRYKKLQPVLAAVFDIPAMTKVAIGPKWTELSDSDKEALTELFGRYLTTMYAARFKAQGGGSIQMGDVKPRDNGKMLVNTKLTRKSGDPVELSYVLAGSADRWHIVDVYYNGEISQIAQLRAEFSAPLRDGGVPKLTAALEEKIKQLQGGA